MATSIARRSTIEIPQTCFVHLMQRLLQISAQRLFEVGIRLSISRRLFKHDHYTTGQVLVVSSAHSPSRGLMIIRASVSTLALCVGAAGTFTTVRAQEADAADQPIVEEVVVTALKRAANLQDVPASITALSADQLTTLGFGSPTDLASQVPNLQATSVMGRQHCRSSRCAAFR